MFKKILIIFLIFIFLLPLKGFADEVFEPGKTCPFFVKDIDKECEKLGQEKCRFVLEQCEKYYQKQSEDYQKEISELQAKKKNLQNEISLLIKKITGFNTQISKNSLIIKDLSFQIKDTQSSIEKTNLKIEDLKNQLRENLRNRHKEDEKSVIEIFLVEEKFSDFVGNLVALESLNLKTQEFLSSVKNLKNLLGVQEEKMSEEKESYEKTQVLAKVQREESKDLQSQKSDILGKTKGEESLYQKYLEETNKKAREIRKKIFELAQIPETEAPTLEQAYKLALETERITNVRAALILGLLQAESAIGKNVGQCNCKGLAFCRYPELTYKDVMRTNQWSYFEQIVSELNLNIFTTPVSCSINGGKVQWGGAMGPAQFMPATWLAYGYKKAVEEITGIVPANPWRIKDAFLAAGIYLKNFGAGSKRNSDEMGAVIAYLCGTPRLTASCKAAGGSNYLYQVMKYASVYQNYIDQKILY